MTAVGSAVFLRRRFEIEIGFYSNLGSPSIKRYDLYVFTF
jgi:hypothetical protein